MAKQTIGIGATDDDGTGDPLRTAFDKVNDNFDELYEWKYPAANGELSSFCAMTDFYEQESSNGAGYYGGGIWIGTQNGTSALSGTPVALAIGARRLTTGTTTTGRATITGNGSGAGQVSVKAADTLKFKGRVRLRPASYAAPDGTDTYAVMLGLGVFSNADGTGTNDFACFYYRWNGSAVDFTSRTRNNGGTVEANTHTTPTADTWFVWEIVVNGTTDVKFYLDGTLVATHTTVPRGEASSIRLPHGIGIYKSAGTSDRGFDVDWLAFQVSR